jgi:glutamyl-tRNA synthetase
VTGTKPRLRFAPSPTGPLHIGGARTALYNWAAARAMGGCFLLRIEDTDRERSTKESLDNILTALRWLGLSWDEGPEQGGEHGPYLQSERMDRYREFAAKLLESSHAYKCYCTPEEVAAGRQRMQQTVGVSMYDRRCRDLTDAQRAQKEAADGRCSIRFKMPLDEVFTVPDLSKGDVQVNLKELDDWVMVRPNGMPLYNFACVVDDHLMAITHVVRGDEHFLNGVKQMVMFRALQQEPPRYAHVPLILGKDGKKLSKREATTNLLDYRDQGYPPAAIFNYIALLGWGFSGDRDIFTPDEMVERFRIESVGSAGARFDEDKLMWMCGDYIRRTPLSELIGLVRPHLVADGVVPAAAFASHEGLIRNVVACHQERIRIYSEISPKVAYLFQDQIELEAKAEKNLRKHADAPQWLTAYRALLERTTLPPSYPADRGDADIVVELPTDKVETVPERSAVPFLHPKHLEADARKLAEELGVKFGHLVQPIRAALTGAAGGAGLFDIVYMLGKERCLARLESACG